MNRIVPVVLVGLVLLAPVAESQQRQQHGKLFPPENLGQLEGPDRDVWQRPDQIMDALNIAEGSVVADLGAAQRLVHDPARAAGRAERQGLRRRHPAADDRGDQAAAAARERGQRRRPVLGTADDPKLPVGELDAVLIVDAYHEMEQPVALLRNAARGAQARRPARHRRVHHGRGRTGAADGRARRSRARHPRGERGRPAPDRPAEHPALPVHAGVREARGAARQRAASARRNESCPGLLCRLPDAASTKCCSVSS